MRGRVSAGILRMMGMPETIAATVDDYVALAVRIAKDRDWRLGLKRGIAANIGRVYRDRSPIVALEEFLDRATRSSH
jgi:protein O-GlcNAc transferase